MPLKLQSFTKTRVLLPGRLWSPEEADSMFDMGVICSDGKKWSYLERNTPQTEYGPSQKVREVQGYRVVSFYRGG